MSTPSSTRLRTVSPDHESDNSQRVDDPKQLNEFASSRSTMNTEDRPIRLRLSMPYSPRMSPPPNRDSSRVIALPSGRFGVLLARDSAGKRPTQKLLPSMSAAQRHVAEFRLARETICKFVEWLASIGVGR